VFTALADLRRLSLVDPTPAHRASEQEFVAPLLRERYQPTQLLAKGGSSLVYRGHDVFLDRDVAIKIFKAGGQPSLDRFRDELRVLASLSHHGVVSIVDAGIDQSSPHDQRPFLVMELLRGKSVRETLAGQPMSAREIGEMGFEVAEALEYVHAQGVIHRDITPANVMLVDYGTTSSRPRARLTDFGIAIDATSAVPVDEATTGTAAYLSPEQARNERLTEVSDIYSLGLVLLECFTQTLAFPGTAIESATLRFTNDPGIPETIPKEWRLLIERMTARDPAGRPTAAQTAVLIRSALRKTRKREKLSRQQP
jgi:serine/threonine protein kinase